MDYVGTASLEEHFLSGSAGSRLLVSSFAEEPSNLQVTNETGADHDVSQDAPVTVLRKDSGPVDGESFVGGGSPRPSAVNKGGSVDAKKLAATGDNLDFGPLGVALAAAAAGIAAYSARRQALENNEPDNPEETK